MAGDPIVFDENYFYNEIAFWNRGAVRMDAFRRSYNRADDLPQLSERLSGELALLIPALNEAKHGMMGNMQLAEDAFIAIGQGLTEVGKNYGLTEDEAESLAGWVD